MKYKFFILGCCIIGISIIIAGIIIAFAISQAGLRIAATNVGFLG